MTHKSSAWRKCIARLRGAEYAIRTESAELPLDLGPLRLPNPGESLSTFGELMTMRSSLHWLDAAEYGGRRQRAPLARTIFSMTSNREENPCVHLAQPPSPARQKRIAAARDCFAPQPWRWRGS